MAALGGAGKDGRAVCVDMLVRLAGREVAGLGSCRRGGRKSASLSWKENEAGQGASTSPAAPGPLVSWALSLLVALV